MDKNFLPKRGPLRVIIAALCLFGAMAGRSLAQSPPSLTAITVSPTNPTNAISQTQQFTATGMFSDSSSRTLTASGGVWALANPLPSATRSLGAAFVNGKLYAISGDISTRVVSYDPMSDTWSTNAALPELRENFASAVVGGKIYVIGGDTNGEARDSVFIYDPVLDTWTNGAPMPSGPRFGLNAAVIDGKIYAAGGYDTDYLTRVEVYDPANDTWITNAPMTIPRNNPGVGAINGQLYVAGGINSFGPETSLEIFDPISGLWGSGPSLPDNMGRTGPAAVLDGKFYFAGAGPAPKDTVIVFDPIWNMWRHQTHLGVARDDLGLAADETGKVLYAVGGFKVSYLKTLEIFTPPEVAWYSSVPAVATNDLDGLVTSLSQGTTMITAAAGMLSNSTVLTVLNLSNTPPTISDIPNQFVGTNTPTGALPFVVSDAETPAENLDLSASSANTNLVPNANIVFGGAGSNRTVTITPAPQLTGTATITVTASDGADTVSDSFTLTVLAANAGQLQFSVTNYTVTEAGVAATITVARSGGSAGVVSVDFTITNGTATAGQDFVNTNGTLIFSNGVVSRTFKVPILNDTLDEPNETVLLSLSNPGGGASLGPRQAAGLTITDDDVAGVVKFSAAAYSVSESNQSATITVVRSGGQASGVTVDFATRDGAASDSSDYVATNGTFTFGAGELTKTFTVPLLPDTAPEGNETVLLWLTNVTGRATLASPSNAVLTIIDDEIALQFSTNNYFVSEGTALGTITVLRTGPANVPVSVGYATSDGSAQAGVDYGMKTGALNFAAGSIKQTFTVPITNNTFVDGNRTVHLTLSAPTGGAQLGPRDTAVLTITNNDLGGVLGFQASAFTVAEGKPAALVTVTRTGGVASGVTVDFTTSNGTATADSDYLATNGTLSFGAGVASRTFTVPILSDALDETNETVQLILSQPTGGASLGARSNAVLTITDDDVAGILKFSSAAYMVSETNPAVTITVSRSGGLAGGVTVDFATYNDGATADADYTPTNGTLVFGPGVLSQTFTVPVLPDGLGEGNETLFLTLTNASGGATLGTPKTAVLKILDDEVAVQFSSATYSVSEAGPAATITLVRSGPVSVPFMVSYATSNGTATAAADYTAKTGSVSFAVGAVSQTFTIPILNDAWVEGNETVNLELSNPTGLAQLGPRRTAVLTIVDNDFGGLLKFSLARYSVAESTAAALITVVRTTGVADGVTVDFATLDGSALAGNDYTATNGTLMFTSGVVSRTFSVPILNDAVHETNKTVILFLANPTGGATLGVSTNALLTITDNDP